ncbi:MAG: hypothetical protein AAF184_19715 [Pseudomonadota bacterium]
MKIMNRLRWISTLAAAGCLLVAAGCGGGGGGGVANLEDPGPVGDDGGTPVAACDPADADTFDSCGVGVVTVTDADGDVLSYAVDIVSLRLERAGGDIVETLPATTRIDFADYVELSELLGAPRLPPGTYVGGSMTLDFTKAEIVVEQDGQAVMANVVDAEGNALTQATIDVALSGDRTQFSIAAGRTALLALDFDLESSNEVDAEASPPVVTVQPVLLAEVNPIEEKELRVRGVLEAVDSTGNAYQVDVRPLGRGDGRFGDVSVRVTDETTYDIDGELFTGADGLAALAALPEDTLTVAFGVLSTSEAAFTAQSVLAGSSVPGIESDTVVGTVVARAGDELTVRGATVVRSGEEPNAFFDSVTVTVGPATEVTRPVDPIDGLTTSAISVGQQVRIFGVANVPVVEEDDGDDGEIDPAAPLILPPLEVDATEGRVQLLRSQVSGIVADNQAGLLTLDLAFMNTRGADVFDFAGTGLAPEFDADPTAYEIDTNGLGADAPVGGAARVFGYVNAFGEAPPDFEAFTTVQFEDLRAVFRFIFNPRLADQAFSSIGADGVALNAEALERGRIRVPGLRVPLGAPQILPMLVPADEPSRYAIVNGDSTEMFEDFAAFSEALALALDGTTLVRSITAAGAYAPLATTLEARSLVVVLRPPASAL